MSSNPKILISPDTFKPYSFMALIAPVATISLIPISTAGRFYLFRKFSIDL